VRPRLVGISGGDLWVLRWPGSVITISDVAPTTPEAARSSGFTLTIEEARALVALLDAALAHDTPAGLLGSVDAGTRMMHVIRWSPAAVSIREDARRHSGWTLRLTDQAFALRNAISAAASEPDSQASGADAAASEASSEQPSPVAGTALDVAALRRAGEQQAVSVRRTIHSRASCPASPSYPTCCDEGGPP
jgi:hypothetical protein